MEFLLKVDVSKIEKAIGDIFVVVVVASSCGVLAMIVVFLFCVCVVVNAGSTAGCQRRMKQMLVDDSSNFDGAGRD